MIEDIGAFLQEMGVGVMGEDIFLGELPPGPDNCLALFEYQGRPPQQWAGTVTPGLQLVSRVKNNHRLAEIKLNDADTILKRVGWEEDGERAGGVAINGSLYLRVYPAMSGALALGTDDNGRVRLARNYYVVIRERE